MVVVAAGVPDVTMTLPGVPAASAGMVSGVVVVVVVVTERVGTGGGGALTVCDSGASAQPARRPSVPQQAMMDVYCLSPWMEAELDRRLIVFIFILPKYASDHFIAMGFNPTALAFGIWPELVTFEETN